MAGAKEFLGRGWSFPPTLDPASGRIALVAYEKDVERAMRILLGTAKGERAMRPEFGCGAHELVFETLDTTTIGQIEASVREVLQRFEPRIDVRGVRASVVDALEGRLLVEIEYALRTVDRRDNLVFRYELRPKEKR